MASTKEHADDFHARIHLHDFSDENRDALKAVYSEWSGDYDEDCAQSHLAYTEAVKKHAESIAKYIDDKEMNILDLCCGTGLLGSYLHNLGFHDIDGLDMSEEMLLQARRKNVYANLFCEMLSSVKPVASVPDETYDALVGSGLFTPGHINESCFPEILRMLAPGGLFIFQMAEVNLQKYLLDMEKEIERLVDEGRWTLEWRETFPEYRVGDPGVRFYLRKTK